MALTQKRNCAVIAWNCYFFRSWVKLGLKMSGHCLELMLIWSEMSRGGDHLGVVLLVGSLG
uniref:Uncharacterized protein n=1 Tax=Rhizophora mucronata TaxID=61149 RepID=A0A2P2L4B7_RHIMU